MSITQDLFGVELVIHSGLPVTLVAGLSTLVSVTSWYRIFRKTSTIGEARGTIDNMPDPNRIQQNILQRTPRGRVATASNWRHFGLSQLEAAELGIPLAEH